MKGDVSSRILAILRELRLTQSDLAATLGTKQQSISRIVTTPPVRLLPSSPRTLASMRALSTTYWDTATREGA